MSRHVDVLEGGGHTWYTMFDAPPGRRGGSARAQLEAHGRIRSLDVD